MVQNTQELIPSPSSFLGNWDLLQIFPSSWGDRGLLQEDGTARKIFGDPTFVVAFPEDSSRILSMVLKSLCSSFRNLLQASQETYCGLLWNTSKALAWRVARGSPETHYQDPLKLAVRIPRHVVGWLEKKCKNPLKESKQLTFCGPSYFLRGLQESLRLNEHNALLQILGTRNRSCVHSNYQRLLDTVTHNISFWWEYINSNPQKCEAGTQNMISQKHHCAFEGFILKMATTMGFQSEVKYLKCLYLQTLESVVISTTTRSSWTWGPQK